MYYIGRELECVTAYWSVLSHCFTFEETEAQRKENAKYPSLCLLFCQYDDVLAKFIVPGKTWQLIFSLKSKHPLPWVDHRLLWNGLYFWRRYEHNILPAELCLKAPGLLHRIFQNKGNAVQAQPSFLLWDPVGFSIWFSFSLSNINL